MVSVKKINFIMKWHHILYRVVQKSDNTVLILR